MLLALLLLAPLARGQPSYCRLDRPDLGVTFDLSSVPGPQLFTDSRGEGSDPWTYSISLCANQSTASLPAACLATTNDDSSPDPLAGAPGPAFQYGSNFCKRLGDAVDNGVLSVLGGGGGGTRDNRGYARGLMLNYTSGNLCYSPSGGSGLGAYVPRKVTLVLECHTGAINLGTALVLEDTACEYYVIAKSSLGCPTQCGTSRDGPCNRRGICGYDATNGP